MFSHPIKSITASVAVCVALVASSAAHASLVTLNFDGLQNGEQVDSYFDGGTGSLGSSGGPNYGITFQNAVALNENLNNVAAAPLGHNVITYLSGPGVIVNAPGGIENYFSFAYSAPFDLLKESFWSGLNGTGTLLFTLTIASTADGTYHSPSDYLDILPDPVCGGKDFCPFDTEGGGNFGPVYAPGQPAGVGRPTENVIAESVVLSGVNPSILSSTPAPGGFAIDDIVYAPAVSPVPLPSTLPMFGAAILGLAGLGMRKSRRATIV